MTPTGWTRERHRFDLRGSALGEVDDKDVSTVQHGVQAPLGGGLPGGEGSIKGLATRAGIDHSLLHYWLGKYRGGELSLDLRREEELVEAEQQIAALQRKVGQLTMEVDLLKKGLISVPEPSSGRSSITSGPAAAAPDEAVP